MKKILGIIIKVVNILMNGFFGIMAVANGVKYATEGYIYSDELTRVFAFILMVGLANGIHWLIQKSIKEF